MEVLLTVAVFGLGMTGMALGVIFSNRHLRGSCGGGDVVTADGSTISCGACPKNERELCPSDDELVRLAQIGHPNPEHHR